MTAPDSPPVPDPGSPTASGAAPRSTTRRVLAILLLLGLGAAAWYGYGIWQRGDRSEHPPADRYGPERSAANAGAPQGAGNPGGTPSAGGASGGPGGPGAGAAGGASGGPGGPGAGAAGGAGGSVGGSAGGGKARGDPSGRAIPVTAVPARTGSIDVYLNALGTVTPRNVVVVKPRVDGQLMKIAFNEGDVVRAGDLLAEIDPRPFEVQLAQAKGQLAKDQALLKNAQLDVERYRTLLAQDSISKQQVDTQEALVRQYEGVVASDQAAVDNARLQLTYARVTAPISGRAGLRLVDAGNIVRASDANGIVVITQMRPITVLFPVPEDNVPRILARLRKKGTVVPVEAWDREQRNKLATGQLTTLDNQIDPATGTVKLRAEFANDDFALFPNQFVNVRMLLTTLPDATLIPAAAIQRGAPGTFVYVVRDDRTVAVTPIKLGPVQGGDAAITSGLEPGALVVVDGTDKLREGGRVEVITRDAAVGRDGPGGPRGRGGSGSGGGGPGGRGARGDPGVNAGAPAPATPPAPAASPAPAGPPANRSP